MVYYSIISWVDLDCIIRYIWMCMSLLPSWPAEAIGSSPTAQQQKQIYVINEGSARKTERGIDPGWCDLVSVEGQQLIASGYSPQ